MPRMFDEKCSSILLIFCSGENYLHIKHKPTKYWSVVISGFLTHPSTTKKNPKCVCVCGGGGGGVFQVELPKVLYRFCGGYYRQTQPIISRSESRYFLAMHSRLNSVIMYQRDRENWPHCYVLLASNSY